MGKGGGKGSGGAGGALGAALAAIRASGLTHTENWYTRANLPRIEHASGAYKGVTSHAEANAIATGKAPARNTGQRLPPIKVSVHGKDISVPDGRHRLRVAQEAGATKIRARVQVAYRGRVVERIVNVPIHGKKP